MISKPHFTNRAFAIAKYMAQEGHEVTVLATANNNRFFSNKTKKNGVVLIEMPDLLWGKLRSGWDLWSGICRLAYLIKNAKNFDLIHLFESRPAVVHPIQIMRIFYYVPVLIDWVDWIGRGGIMEVLRPAWYRIIFGRIETFYEEYFKNKFEGITVICDELRNRALGLNISNENILKLPVGSEVIVDTESVNKRKNREGLKISSSFKIIAFSGVDAIFDFPIILETLKLLLREDDTYRLMVTGNAGKNILKLIKDYDLQQRVILTGFLSYEEFYRYLACVDIFLLPFPDTIYNRGRWPSKINDYLSIGRPIVTNAVGELRELFANYKIGACVNYDAGDFAREISKIFSNENMYNEYSKNALFVAKNILSWSKLVNDLEHFYSKFTNNNNEKTSLSIVETSN